MSECSRERILRIRWIARLSLAYNSKSEKQLIEKNSLKKKLVIQNKSIKNIIRPVSSQ